MNISPDLQLNQYLWEAEPGIGGFYKRFPGESNEQLVENKYQMPVSGIQGLSCSSRGSHYFPIRTYVLLRMT